MVKSPLYSDTALRKILRVRACSGLCRYGVRAWLWTRTLRFASVYVQATASGLLVSAQPSFMPLCTQRYIIYSKVTRPCPIWFQYRDQIYESASGIKPSELTRLRPNTKVL